MPKLLNNSEFIEKCKIIHPALIFDKTEYIGCRNKVLVTCSEHGDFTIRATNLISGRGCRKCGFRRDYAVDYQEYLIACNIKHNYFYDYSKITSIPSVINYYPIICPIHGEFFQQLYIHKSGCGCKKCFYETIQTVGFTLKSWKSQQKGRLATVYFIKIFNQTEIFYKVGITYRNVKVRFANIPYKYEILNTKTSYDCELIYNIEKRFKKIYQKQTYNPLIKFGGFTECFK